MRCRNWEVFYTDSNRSESNNYRNTEVVKILRLSRYTYVHKSIVMSITCTVEPLYCDIPWGRKMMSLYRGFQEGAQLPFKYM